jgi:hypothetical protein
MSRGCQGAALEVRDYIFPIFVLIGIGHGKRWRCFTLEYVIMLLIFDELYERGSYGAQRSFLQYFS